MKQETIFVCGAQRSGTTLLQTIIANLLQCALLPEAHVMQDVIAAYSRGLRLWNKAEPFFGTRQAFSQAFTEILAIQLSAINRQLGNPDFIVLKDPNFSAVADIIRDIFPGKASIVLIVRDPRDIAASFIKIGERQLRMGEKSKYTSRDIGFICKKINEAYSLDASSSKSHFDSVVRYEALVANPAKTVEQMFGELSLARSGITGRLDSLQWLDSARLHQKAWATELEGSGISESSVGSYQEVLRENEIGKIEERCASMMGRFGYRAT